MLYISYGAKKSGSTFTYLMTRELCRAAGHADALIPADVRGDPRGASVNTVRLWTPDVVEAMSAFVPDDEIVALRTHVPATAAAADLIGSGRARHHVGIRDLRDIALSLTDVISRLNERGLDRGRIIQPGDISTTFVELQRNVDAMTSWADIPGALVVPYEGIAFDTKPWLVAISANMGLSVDPDRFDSIVAAAVESPSVKMNVAQPLRHRREMSAADQQMILDRFSDFYARFFPGASVNVSEDTASVGRDAMAPADQPTPQADISDKRLAKRALRLAGRGATRI